MKKFFIALFLLIGLRAMAQNVTATGTIGETNNITWTLYDDYSLVFTGTGSMGELSLTNDDEQDGLRPWETGITGLMHYWDSPIVSVTIGEGITDVAPSAFSECQYLTSATLPSTLTTLGHGSFSECKLLSAIQLPDGLTTIGDHSFSGCGLTSISLPASVRYVGYFAFAGTNLSGTFTFPEGVETIKRWVFDGCHNLTRVLIPSTVTTIESLERYESGIAQIVVATNNPVYDSRDNCNGIIHTATNTLLVACRATTIPSTLVSIGDAFMEKKWLTSLNVPENITSLQERAFADCFNLEEVHIPNTVTNIASRIFSGCNKLQRIYIGSGVTTMHLGAFTTYNYDEQLFPALTDLYIYTKVPPTIHANSFVTAGARSGVRLHVPAGCIGAYRQADGWGNFVNIVGDAIQIENNEENYVITEGQNYTNNLNMQVQNLTYTRTFNNTKWQALYLPFPITYAEWDAAGLEVARIVNFLQYDLDNDGEGETQVCEVIKQTAGCTTVASYPYFVRAKSAGTKTITVHDVTLLAAEDLSIDCSTVDYRYVFTGYYSAHSMGPSVNDDYEHEFSLSGGSLQYAASNVSLPPYRWSVKIETRFINSTVPQRIAVREHGEEELTFLEEITLPTSQQRYIYSIDGCLLGVVDADADVYNMGLSTGFYVVNGEKIFVR